MTGKSLWGWLGWAFAMAAAQAAPWPERTERTFPAAPGATLRLDSYRGAVTIEEAPDGQATEIRVRLEVEADAETAEAAAKVRDGLEVTMTETGDGVRLAATHRHARVRFRWEEGGELELTWRITVPRRTNVDVRVTNGSITVGNLAGQVRVETETGNIFVRRIEGAVEARVRQNGETIVSRATGNVTVHALAGTIRTGTIGGRAELHTGSGDVEILQAYGPVVVRSTVGEAAVGFPRTIGGPADILADGGNVRVTIDPAAACAIDATARWGRVRSALELEQRRGAEGSGRVTGIRNGGGPGIVLRADGGNVRIEAGETYFEPDSAAGLPASPDRAAQTPERGPGGR